MGQGYQLPFLLELGRSRFINRIFVDHLRLASVWENGVVLVISSSGVDLAQVTSYLFVFNVINSTLDKLLED